MPAIALTGVEHDSVFSIGASGVLRTPTVHARHTPMPQHSFVPVKSCRSCRKSMRFMSASSAAASTGWPFTTMRTGSLIAVPPESCPA